MGTTTMKRAKKGGPGLNVNGSVFGPTMDPLLNAKWLPFLSEK